MKTRSISKALRHSAQTPLLALSLLAAPLVSGRAASPEPPFYEETFNAGGGTVELFNGAAIGEPSSGVSGLADDTSYVATDKPANGPGPVAKILSELPDEPLEEFTLTVWYKAKDSMEGSILNTRGVVLCADKEKWYLRVNDSHGTGSREKYYNAGTSITNPPGEWQFLAVTWNRAEDTAIFYAGSKSEPTNVQTEARQGGNAPALGFSEATFLRAIGNTYVRAADGAFVGNIDNLRMFSKVLDAEQIEAIRQSDLTNQQPKSPAK